MTFEQLHQEKNEKKQNNAARRAAERGDDKRCEIIKCYCGTSRQRYIKDLIRFLSFLLIVQKSPHLRLRRRAHCHNTEARALSLSLFFFSGAVLRHAFTPPLTSFLSTANLHLARASGCSLYTRNKMAAYSTLHLARLLRPFSFRQRLMRFLSEL